MDKNSFLKILILTVFTSVVALYLVSVVGGYSDQMVRLNENIYVKPDTKISKEDHYVQKEDEKVSEEKELGGGNHYSIGEMEEGREIISEPLESISAGPYPGDILSVDGVMYFTNQERAEEGVRSLVYNEKLALAARRKMNDMFDRQYFAHDDPDGGMGAGLLAADVGYEYILIGENLAMGNFRDDEDLVESWMNSPGHRLNIIKEDYSEIGVAVGEGEYQGRVVWMAVQIFGRPLSECPVPNEELRSIIENNNLVLDFLSREMSSLEERINEGDFSSNREYREAIDQYNIFVGEYNRILEETKILIERLNTEIRIFNDCIET